MWLDDWHPVTHDFGLIRARLETVVSGFCEWYGSVGTRHRRTEITEGLEAALTALLPLSHAKQRQLFVQTEADWTAFYQNGIAGSDPFPAMRYLSERLGVLAMRVCATPPKSVYPATIWEVYAPPALGGIPPLGYRRSIAAANDGGRWVFHEYGERFEFECVDAYTARRKRDRFTPEHLRQYLGHFGIRPFEDDFLRVDTAHPAVMLQEKHQPAMRHFRGRSHPRIPEFTLEQVRDGAPWRRTTHPARAGRPLHETHPLRLAGPTSGVRLRRNSDWSPSTPH